MPDTDFTPALVELAECRQRQQAIKQAAEDIAPELGRLINEYLSSGTMLGGEEYNALSSYLWDNKVGILRVIESVVFKRQTSSEK